MVDETPLRFRDPISVAPLWASQPSFFQQYTAIAAVGPLEFWGQATQSVIIGCGLTPEMSRLCIFFGRVADRGIRHQEVSQTSR